MFNGSPLFFFLTTVTAIFTAVILIHKRGIPFPSNGILFVSNGTLFVSHDTVELLSDTIEQSDGIPFPSNSILFPSHDTAGLWGTTGELLSDTGELSGDTGEPLGNDTYEIFFQNMSKLIEIIIPHSIREHKDLNIEAIDSWEANLGIVCEQLATMYRYAILFLIAEHKKLL